jgi:hypothetical protein
MGNPSDHSTPSSLQVERDELAERTDYVHTVPTLHTPDSIKSGHPRLTEQTYPQNHTSNQKIDVSHMGAWILDNEYVEPQKATEQGRIPRSLCSTSC